MRQSATAWAQEEFGAAALGDERRVRRLVRVAVDAARRPSGTIAGTMKGKARREGAFRLVENDAVPVQAMAQASHRATARRCRSEESVIVPVDATALSLTDRTGTRGLGPVGSPNRPTKGIHVMSALAVGRCGQPIGLLDQKWWVRPRTPLRRTKKASGRDDRRPHESRESYYWVECLRTAEANLQAEAPGRHGWYQLDRGGDAMIVLAAAADQGLLVTVRAQHSRRLTWPNRSVGHLAETIRRQPVAGYYECHVPKRPKQRPRQAVLAVRYLKVPLALPIRNHHRRTVWMTAVAVREVRAPAGEQPLSWLLLTNRKVATLHDALQVVAAYTLRWRVEDFHKTWKSGACAIESSQLRAPDHLIRWGTIMAAVASRIERIKHQARSQPELPASVEFTQDEIDATIVLRKNETRVAYKPGDVPTLGEVVRWIADLGGYMGSRSSPPPGSVVLRRGLEQVAAAAVAIRALREGRSG